MRQERDEKGLFCPACGHEMDEPHPNFGRFYSSRCLKSSYPATQAGHPNPAQHSGLRIHEADPEPKKLS
jgi:hypothetical protein